MLDIFKCLNKYLYLRIDFILIGPCSSLVLLDLRPGGIGNCSNHPGTTRGKKLNSELAFPPIFFLLKNGDLFAFFTPRAKKKERSIYFVQCYCYLFFSSHQLLTKNHLFDIVTIQKEKRQPGLFSFKIVAISKKTDIWCSYLVFSH